MSVFRLLKYADRGRLSIYKVNVATDSGTIMTQDATNPMVLVPATNEFRGFLLQNVVHTDVPTLLNFIAGIPNTAVFNVKVGGLVDIETQVWEVLTNVVVRTGTGALSEATAKNIKLSIYQGKFRVAQTGDVEKAVLLRHVPIGDVEFESDVATETAYHIKMME